jgi:hypothetical protein
MFIKERRLSHGYSGDLRADVTQGEHNDPQGKNH